MPNNYYPFDSRLEHRALGSAALTATAVLGDVIDQRAQHRTMYMTKVNLEAIKISANNESYKVVAEVCNSANFSSTPLEVAGIIDLGATEVRTSGAPDNAAADEYEMYWATEVNGTKYQYARLRLVAAGTSPSITLGVYSSIVPRG